MLGDPWEYLWVAQFASPFSGPESTVSGWRFRLTNAGEDAEGGRGVQPAGFLSSLQPGPLTLFPLALLLLPVVFCPLLTQVQDLSHTYALILLLILSYNSHLPHFPETT